MLEALLMQIDLSSNTNIIMTGVATFLIGLAIERAISYVRKRHDSLMKNSYDLNTLFDNYTNLKKSTEEMLNNQYEAKMVAKELIAKMDMMMGETKDTKKAYSKILEVLYRHDTQIRVMANNRNLNTDVLDSMRIFEDEEERKD